MRERTASLSGNAVVSSEPAAGGSFQLTLPLIGVGVACAAASAGVIVADPVLAIMTFDDLREGQLEACAAMVLTVAGAVLLGRFRRHGSRRDVRLAAALFVLAATNLFVAIATPIVDSLAASPVATWTAAGGTVVGAGLLVAAATLPDRTVLRRGPAALTVLATACLALAAAALTTLVVRASLPDAFATIPGTVPELRTFPVHRVLGAVDLWMAAAWTIVAGCCTGVARRHDDTLLRSLSLGAVVAAAASVNYALFPSRYTELLYSGDLFFLVAVGVVLHGAIREVTGTEAALVRSAVSTERQRVASELRAGVAQELALMATQSDWIARQPPEQRRLDVLSASVARALDESRDVIAALDRPADEPLAAAVAYAVHDVASRLGVRIECNLDERAQVSREWREALVRFTRDAIVIAVRDHGAGHVVVDVRDGQRVAVRITYDGDRGVVASSGAARSIDARALRERVETLGATVSEQSAAQAGTVIEVLLP